MTATPDSFSLADLEALYEDAVREEDITPDSAAEWLGSSHKYSVH